MPITMPEDLSPARIAEAVTSDLEAELRRTKRHLRLVVRGLRDRLQRAVAPWRSTHASWQLARDVEATIAAADRVLAETAP